jgi:O-antigen/teichoic acid export membrane protein
MRGLRNTLRATLTQQGFEVVAMTISFVAVPLYLTYLGNERYGLMLTAQAWAGYLGFGNVGISQSTMILVSHAAGRNDPAELSRTVRSGFFLGGLAAILIALVTTAFFLALRFGGVAPALRLTHSEVPGLVLAIGFQVMTSIAFSTIYDLLIGLQEVNRTSVFHGADRVVSQVTSLAVAVFGGSVGQVTASSALVSVLIGSICIAQTRSRHPEAFQSVHVTREQLVLQLRTGAKSAALQIGSTLVGTAPTLTIATVAGPMYVPLFAVPARLFTLGTGMIYSFSAMLQPLFGEAFARADLAWIGLTVSRVWEKTLLFLALGIAFLLGVGGPFISLWTAGKLQVSTAMLGSVAMVGAATSALAPIRFLLSGINRHKWAALTEIVNGSLAILFTFIAIKELSADWVGLGVLSAAACTSLWIFPAQAKFYLSQAKLAPNPGRLVKILICALAVYGAASGMAAVGRHWVPDRTLPVLLLSASGATLAAVLGVIGLSLVDWRELFPTRRSET